MEAKHTPTPWRVIDNEPGNGYGSMDITPLLIEGESYAIAAVIGDVAGIDPQANAAFIVRACNSHDALVEALKELLGVSCVFGQSSSTKIVAANQKDEAALALAGELP
jgi:hypothetical protein